MRGLSTTDGRSRGFLTVLATLGEFLGTVTCTSALVLAVVLPLIRWEPISTEHVHLLLTVATATIGATAAILGAVAARLVGDRRLSWLAAALASYCLVVLPVTILRPSSMPEGAVPQAAWLAGQAFVVGLLVVALRPPALLGVGAALTAVGVGAIAAQAAGELAALLAGRNQAMIVPAVLTAAVLAGWGVVGFGLLLVGYHDRNPALMGVSLGLTTSAGVHLYWTSAGPAAAGVDLLFDQLRLVGLIVVFAGTLGLARRALSMVDRERLAHDEEMRLAAVHLARAADQAVERDHELRNGLAGLSGITAMLSSSATSDEREGLRSAMLAELARLAAMIDGSDRDGDRLTAGGRYDVTAELHRLARLRRAAGAQIVFAPPDSPLCALGSPAVLAQVMVNLLANCAQHAPGSPVWVSVDRRVRRISVTVRDEGPGVPPGQERAILDRGVRDAHTGGHGLGLYLSRRLLSAEGADLRILPGQPGSTGCTVVVELPVAPEPVETGGHRPEPAPRVEEPGPR